MMFLFTISSNIGSNKLALCIKLNYLLFEQLPIFSVDLKQFLYMVVNYFMLINSELIVVLIN